MSVFWPRCRALMSVVFDGRGAPNSKPLTIEATPRNATVTRNGYQEADTWSIDFDARLLPFDPELIASMAVRIYMYDAEGDDTREWALERYEMVRGLADNANLDIEDKQSFKCDGRDYTGVLDPEWNPKKKIPSGKPLDKTIEDMADAAAPANTQARFEVKWESSRPIPIVGAAHRSTKKKGLWVKPGKTYWDTIYEMALSHGFIVYIRDSTIIVTDPAAQTRASLAQAARVVHGRHLSELHVERKLSRSVVPQIMLVAWDPVTRKRIEVRYPEKKFINPGTGSLSTALGTKRDDVVYLPAPPGIIDRDTLRAFAKMRYEQMGRSESVYRFSTKFLAVGVNDGLPEAVSRGTVDLLRLQAGSPVAIAFDAFNAEQMRNLTAGQREAHLRSLGYSEQVSEFVAANYDRIDQFRQPYYTREANYEMSDDGLTISVEAVNYASEARERRWE